MKINPDERHIIPVSVKFSQRLERLICEIGAADDRGKSYVVRELMRRGLTLYLQDRRIKPTEEEELKIAQMIKNGASIAKPDTTMPD